jgi:hypothetical protein
MIIHIFYDAEGLTLTSGFNTLNFSQNDSPFKLSFFIKKNKLIFRYIKWDF